MNDDVKDNFETINGGKVRKQSEHVRNDSAETVSENPCTNSFQSINDYCSKAETSCGSSFSGHNGSGSTMNNLNSRSVSNGFSSKYGESSSRDHVNGQCNNSSTRYRSIYHNSSSEDDDEHCVYTYKGAEVGSDVPKPFLYLGMNVPNGETRNSLCSSPDMDYLEMDFDPGPSNDQDSDSDNNTLFIRSSLSPNENVISELPRVPSTETQALPDNEVLSVCDENANCFAKHSTPCIDDNAKSSSDHFDLVVPCCSKSLTTNEDEPQSNDLANDFDLVIPCCSKSLTTKEDEPQSNDLATTTINSCNSDDYFEYSSEDELPCDRLSVAAELNVCTRKLSENSDNDEIVYIPDAFQRSFKESQNDMLDENMYDISFLDSNLEDSLECYYDLAAVDPSYSISAFVNVLKLLRIFDDSAFNRQTLINLLQRKQIPENVSLVEYLYMRAVQNANENDLANFASAIFEKKLYSRFFHTYPETDVNLLEWLNIWIRRGAVPVVSRNVQERGILTTKNIDRDPWQHNVVYKVESPYLYITNPLEKISESLLHSQLSQAPLIFVKRTSILKRWTSKVDLRALMRANHNRWYNENVLGQVATVIREHNSGSKNTQYVRVPSNCNCGITLFVSSENVALCQEVEDALELPLVCC